MSAEIIPWQPSAPVELPRHIDSAAQVVPLARQLRQGDIEKIVRAFDAGLFDFAVEYVWRRTMSVLKKQLAAMGPSFVGELLARPDIDDNSSIEQSVTDYDAIVIAERLGIVNRRGAMELRQATELLSYYANPDAEDDYDLPKPQALSILQSCVSNILARDNIEPAIDFITFRRSLTQGALSPDHPDISGLNAAPYFFKRTIVRVLLADARTTKGAQAENALSNLTTILVLIWQDLQDPDRWQVGQAYAEANANNNKLVSAALRRILLQLQGFDYVPETLRSSTYTKAANDVLAAHWAMNNFYNEPAPMRALSSLGSTIPGPAFQICMQATLAVKLGNQYGVSFAAQEYADQLLGTLAQRQWVMYLDRFLPSDEVIVEKLTSERPAIRWCELMSSYHIDPGVIQVSGMASLLRSSLELDSAGVMRRAEAIRKRLRG